MIDINAFISELKTKVKNILIQEFNIDSAVIENSESQRLIAQLTAFGIESHDDYKLLSNKISSLKNIELLENSTEEKINKISISIINSRNKIHQELFYKNKTFLKDSMNKALKEITVPFLRKNGFKGSFPKFKKVNNDIEYSIIFMYSHFGAEFSVELGLTNQTTKRNRLSRINDNKNEWFNFENHTEENNLCVTIANEIIENWNSAENWWKIAQ
jgi:hypothetical protein